MQLEEIFLEPGLFISPLIQELRSRRLLKGNDMIDHICYKTSSLFEYEEKKRLLEKNNTLLSEAMIHGRPIATYQLNVPLQLDAFKIPLLELTAPKNLTPTESGWHHIEVVKEGSRFYELDVLNPKFEWDTLKKSVSINPEISLRLNSGLVKFHPQSLESVIQKEKGIFQKNNSDKIFVFDLDGTLLNTAHSLLLAIQDTVSEYFKKKIELKEVKEKFSHQLDQLLVNFKIPENQIQKLVIHFSKHYFKYLESDQIFLGVSTALSVLRESGYRLFLWTARDGITATQLLQNFQIYKYFDDIFYFQPSGPNKPVPSQSMLDRFRSYKIMGMFGDSSTDECAAKNLNTEFISADFLHEEKKLYAFLNQYCSHSN